MKSSRPPDHLSRVVSLALLALILMPAPVGAQNNKLPVPLPRQVVPRPVKPATVQPVPRVAPVREQRQARQQRPTPPTRQTQASGDPVAARIARARASQGVTQVNRGGGTGKNPAAGQISRVPRPGAFAGGRPAAGGFTMPPNARKVAMPGGGATIVHPDGRRWLVDKDNHITAFSRPGMQAKFNGNGSLSTLEVNRPGAGKMLIARGVHGDRLAAGMRPGGVIVVTYGKNHGFVQQPSPGRPAFVQRTYLVDGRPSVHVYRVARYGGVVYLRYVPATSHPPGFYARVLTPWPKPVAYKWGANQAPGISLYAGYFTPDSSYPTASLWLTDFVLAEDLQRAYERHQEYQPDQEGAPEAPETESETVSITPEVKNAIAQSAQLQVQSQQADSGATPPPRVAGNRELPPTLDPNQRTFVVSESFDGNQGSAPCTLTPGDVIYRTGDNLVAGNKVGVNVLSSKAGDCAANIPTQIDFIALQEMLNQFRQQIEAGLSKLAASQGHGGIPAGSPSDTQLDPAGSAQADPNAAAVLQQQQNDADVAEVTATDGANGDTSM
jgi:hypothetical protein